MYVGDIRLKAVTLFSFLPLWSLHFTIDILFFNFLLLLQPPNIEQTPMAAMDGEYQLLLVGFADKMSRLSYCYT